MQYCAVLFCSVPPAENRQIYFLSRVGKSPENPGCSFLLVARVEAPWAHSDLRVRVLGDLPKKAHVWLVATIIWSHRRRPVFPALRMFAQHLREDGKDVGVFITNALIDSQSAADDALGMEPQAVRVSMALGLGPM